MDRRKELQEAWTLLSQRLKLGDSVAGEELLERYSEVHRAFHTTAHLWQVVALLEEMRADDRLMLAAWFHDAVYEPGRSDNEIRSAHLARDALAPFGFPPADLGFVCAAILATASHATERAEFWPLLDADLSILGSAPSEYETYRDGIRKEFRQIPQAVFAAGRVAFLREVLARPAIFRTPYCARRFEAAARRNLLKELEQHTL